MYYWRQRACQHCRYKVVLVDNWKEYVRICHPVFEMFYSKQRKILKKGHSQWRFVNTGSSGIEDFLLKPQTPVSTVSTNIAFNALYALIFVSTGSTNKIPYSIYNSIALIFCIDFLDMPFRLHTTDKVTMGLNEWLPHYLIWSRSHCNSKG